MLPRLYQTIDNFDTKNGYGFFNGCSKCEITTEENGEYYCDLNLNPDDRLANTITPGQIVKAKANSKDNPQLFEVNNVEIDKNGYVTAKCAHIKEWFLNLTTDGGGVVGDIDNPYWFTGTAQQIVDEVMSNISTQHRFSITVTGFGNTQKTLKIGFEDPTSLADIFFSDEGLVNLFGGFVKFNNFSVSFQKVSGTVTQKEIRYGSSISEYNQVINNDNVYSKVYGLAKFEWEYNPYDRGKYQEISRGSIVDVPNTTSITNKTLIIDVSNKLRKKKYTNEELSDAENEVSAATSGYVQNHLIL